MSILCFIQGHAPGADEVWNRGYSFSRCRRCQCDMIRADADWETVPRGHKVVWKAGPSQHSRPAGLARNLPVLYREPGSGLPTLWRGGWLRQVRRMLGGGSGALRAQANGTAVFADEEEATREARQTPYLLAVFAVAGANFQLLFLRRPRA